MMETLAERFKIIDLETCGLTLGQVMAITDSLCAQGWDLHWDGDRNAWYGRPTREVSA